MECEAFEDVLEYVRGKQCRDNDEEQQRREKLKDVAFRVSKRLDGLKGSRFGGKYQKIILDSQSLLPQTRIQNSRNMRKRRNHRSSSTRKLPTRLKSLSLSMPALADNSEAKYPTEGTASLHASQTLGYSPKIFPSVRFDSVRGDGRPLPHKRLKIVAGTRPVHRWFSAGPTDYVPLPTETEQNFYGPINDNTIATYRNSSVHPTLGKTKKNHSRKRRKKKRVISKYLSYPLFGVVLPTPETATPIGQRMIMLAQHRRGALQMTYDKLNDASTKITRFLRNTKGTAVIWKWKQQIRHAIFLSCSATIIQCSMRIYLSKQCVIQRRKEREMHLRKILRRNAAICIQCMIRCHKARARKRYVQKIRCARQEFKKRMLIKRSARVVQRSLQKHVKKKKIFVKVEMKAKEIQRSFRGWLVRNTKKKKNS
jgi:hypothetical protein